MKYIYKWCVECNRVTEHEEVEWMGRKSLTCIPCTNPPQDLKDSKR